jgi:hypothetical protein
MLCLTVCAIAQTATTGAISGQVTDPTGAVVPKAQVQLTNTETNATVSQLSNDSGQFGFSNVNPGSYKINVKLAGFRAETVSGITVDVNKTTSVGVRLEVGTDSTIVEVSAKAAAQLRTRRSATRFPPMPSSACPPCSATPPS